MALGDVVDQLLDQHGLADAGAAEQADLAALGIRREQVDHLDAGDQDRGLGRLVDEERRLGMDRGGVGVADRAALVDRLADHVHDPAERHRADRHADLRAGVGHLLAAGQALGGVHGDGAHGRFAEMLGDLEDEAVAAVRRLERRQDRRQLAVEGDVDDGADHLADAADILLAVAAVAMSCPIPVLSLALIGGPISSRSDRCPGLSAAGRAGQVEESVLAAPAGGAGGRIDGNCRAVAKRAARGGDGALALAARHAHRRAAFVAHPKPRPTPARAAIARRHLVPATARARCARSSWARQPGGGGGRRASVAAQQRVVGAGASDWRRRTSSSIGRPS